MTMAEHDLIEAFDNSIDLLNSGGTVADCLNRYPQYAGRLGPLLDTGRVVQRARIEPLEVQAAQANGRARLEEAIRAIPARHTTPVYPLRRWLSMAAGLVLILSVFLGGTALAAENTLPGDTLYSVKRFTESVRLALFDGSLEQVFAQRRIEEIRQLEALNRAEQVDFAGEIERIDGVAWQVAGLEVLVPANIPGASSVKVSDIVRVTGQTTTAGTLVAGSVDLLEPGSELPTPTAMPGPTSSPSPATPTQTPQPTQEPPPSGAGGCLPASPAGWVSYTVRSGDTLSALAGATNTTLEQLMQVNCIEDARFIVAGQQLFLPSTPPLSPGGGVPARDSGGGTSGRGSGDSSSGSGSD